MFARIAQTLILAQLLLTIGFIAPQPVQAGGQPVTVVSDVSSTNVKTSIESTASAFSNALTAAASQYLVVKESVLDTIAYSAAKIVLKSMTTSIVNWINSGFQGSPAFLSDLESYLKGIADQVISDTLYGSDLAFLCSPFELDVRIALAVQFNEKQDGFQPQCTLSDVSNNIENFLNGAFNEGGWGAWFELTQGETNDPNKAYFAAEADISAKIRNAQGQEITLLEFGDGFLSFKVCSDAQAQSGAEKNCTITTPGQVIADQINASLGVGRDTLIAADEINEIIGALLSQLAQRALAGVNGLLGLGGNSTYADYSYGDDGDRTFLEELEDEDVVPLDDVLGPDDMERALAREEEYLDLISEIDARFTAIRQEYDRAREAHEPCFRLSYPSQFDEWQETAAGQIPETETLILVLEELVTRFNETEDVDLKEEILNEYLDLVAEQVLTTQSEYADADLNLTYRYQYEIDQFSSSINAEITRCTLDDDDDE